MKIRSKVKNTVLAGLAGLTLTACGGGGGGGAVSTVSNFINNDVTNLDGSASIVSSYSSLISGFQSTISSGDISAIQGVITGPDENDIAQANTLLTQLSSAETLWAQTEDLIASQSDADKYTIYNSDSYKEAYAAMVYLKEHVKPIIQKVANGSTITLADYNKIAKEDKAQEIINTEKDTTASEYASAKLIKNTETITNDSASSVDSTGDSTITYTDWATVYAGGGDEQRTKTTSVANLRTTTTTRCTFTRTTLLNGTATDGAQTCTVLNTTTTDLDPTVTTEVETRTGDNPVTATVNLDDNVSTTTEETA